MRANSINIKVKEEIGRYIGDGLKGRVLGELIVKHLENLKSGWCFALKLKTAGESYCNLWESK